MCPDRQIVSLYLDGELPSPWKEKMEAHLEACEKCRAILAGYSALGKSLRDLPAEKIAASQERVWAKLAAREMPAPVRKPMERRPADSIWRKTVTLPLPAAAAAAAIIVIAFAVLVGFRSGYQQSQNDYMAVSGVGLDDYEMPPMQNMDDVRRYLSSQDSGDVMVIPLPESKRFSRFGEPALINAADYSRRISSR